jgi:hypothetical protein
VRLVALQKNGDFRRVSLTGWGEATLAIRHSAGGRAAELAALRKALAAVAPVVEGALVRRSKVANGEVWFFVVNGYPPFPPYNEPGDPLARERHLLGARTLDAYGLQVLTDRHVARAKDLTGWDVRPLGAGRHLVQARDLDPWYATDRPDPAVLDQARADFGPLILTRDDVLHDPGPFAGVPSSGRVRLASCDGPSPSSPVPG